MKSVKLTALLTTIVISTTMILPAFATESTSNTVAPGSTTTTVPTTVTEHKELTYGDMYIEIMGQPFRIIGEKTGGILRFNSIVEGYPDGTFRPYSTITKAECATIVANSMNYVRKDVMGPFPLPERVMMYKDVNKSTPAYAAIKECYEAEVFNGSPDGLFNPNKMLTQAEAVVILDARLDKTYIEGYLDTSRGTEFIKQIPNHWARNSYANLINRNIFRESEIKLDPDAYISRIDLVCMLENLFWYDLPHVEKFTEEQYSILEYDSVSGRAPQHQTPLALPYYVTGITDTIQYTTKFSDISDLKDYQKYALTRCVEK